MGSFGAGAALEGFFTLRLLGDLRHEFERGCRAGGCFAGGFCGCLRRGLFLLLFLLDHLTHATEFIKLADFAHRVEIVTADGSDHFFDDGLDLPRDGGLGFLKFCGEIDFHRLTHGFLRQRAGLAVAFAHPIFQGEAVEPPLATDFNSRQFPFRAEFQEGGLRHFEEDCRLVAVHHFILGSCWIVCHD